MASEPGSVCSTDGIIRGFEDPEFWQQLESAPVPVIPEGVVILGDHTEVAPWLEQLVSQNPDQYLAYLIGKPGDKLIGEATFLKLQKLGWGAIVGIQSGRSAREQVDLVPYADKCTGPSAVFRVPGGEMDPNTLAKDLGVYRHPNVIHIADPFDIEGFHWAQDRALSYAHCMLFGSPE
jgi:hypothetical protein